MKKFLVILAFICVNLTAYSQQIIVSERPGYDVTNVYITRSAYEADATVYVSRNRYESNLTEGQWYIEQPRNYHYGSYRSYNCYGNGCRKIYYVDRRYKADVVIKFTRYRSGVRIRNSRYYKYF
jgi:hypothetical protein